MPYVKPGYLTFEDETTCGLEEAQARYLQAEENLQRQLDRWDSYDGNNPNKYRGAIKDARIWTSRWAYNIRYIYKGELPVKGESNV